MTDIPFAFIIDGKPLDPLHPDTPEQAAQLQQVVSAISDHVDGLVCPQHKEAPRFLCSGSSFEELSVEIHGCCETLVEMAGNCLTPP